MISWNVFREMETLQRELDRNFAGLALLPGPQRVFRAAAEARNYPQISLSEDADNFYLASLLPGVELATLEIELAGNCLNLRGERSASKSEGGSWQRQERTQGKFRRAVELPLEVERDQISAEYVDGVLQVLLPKVAAVKPHRIKVNT